MKLWQYGVIIVLIIFAWYIGVWGGYDTGYAEGYDWGYTDGGFDEGWHAATQSNTPYTTLGDITFSYTNDMWIMNAPNYNGTYSTYYHDTVQGVWLSEDYV